MKGLFITLGVLFLGLLAPPLASAQAPMVESRHFRFFHVEGSARNTARIASIAEERFQVLCAMLDVCDIAGEEPIDVYLAPDAEEFAGAFHRSTPMSEWAVGVAFVNEGRIVLRAHGSALFSLEETFDHELSHVLLHRGAAPAKVPRWFSEGVAIWQAGESVLERMMPAQRAALTDKLVPLEELASRFPAQGPAVSLAYAEAALFLRWAIGRGGADLVPGLVSALRMGVPFEDAFEERVGMSLDEAEVAWKETLEGPGLFLSVLSDQNVIWTLLTVLFLITARIKILRKRERLAEMAREEAAAQAARVALLEASASHGEPTLH